MAGKCLLLFAILLLPVLTSLYSSGRIDQPAILLIGAGFVLINSTNHQIRTIQKFILLYIALMFFNQLANSHILVNSFAINSALIALIPLALSYCLMQVSPHAGLTSNKDVLRSWLTGFAVIIVHMLVLWLLFNRFYGFGYENNFAVLANLCLYFLGFVFLWNQLDAFYISRFIAIFFMVYFIVLICGRLL